MVMDAVVERCVEQSPVTVMARLALQRALEPAWVDELFERECGTQYTREQQFAYANHTTQPSPLSALTLAESTVPSRGRYHSLRAGYIVPAASH